MKRTKTGYRVAVTNRINDLLEQGGVCGRVVIVQWGAFPGLWPDVSLNDPYNDLYTFGDMVRDCAYGRCGDQRKVRVVRKGTVIV